MASNIFGILTLTAMVFISAMVTLCMADATKDREECEEQLVGLATCLPYVGGDGKSPTPDCCNGLKQVLKNNKTCLCVVIRDRDDPELGLKINVTLALGLPSVCHASANVSQCPALLHLNPTSPEAQVFYQLRNISSQGAFSPASSPSAGGSVSGGPSAQPNTSGCCKKQSLIWLEFANLLFPLILLMYKDMLM